MDEIIRPEYDRKICRNDNIPDFKNYSIKFKEDTNPNIVNEGVVVSDREWTYQINDYYSTVNVGLDFITHCTFVVRNSGAVKRLALVDQDNAEVLANVEVNLHPGVPCVCVCAEDLLVKKKKVQIRIPDKLGNLHENEESVIKNEIKLKDIKQNNKVDVLINEVSDKVDERKTHSYSSNEPENYSLDDLKTPVVQDSYSIEVSKTVVNSSIVDDKTGGSAIDNLKSFATTIQSSLSADEINGSDSISDLDVILSEISPEIKPKESEIKPQNPIHHQVSYVDKALRDQYQKQKVDDIMSKVTELQVKLTELERLCPGEKS